MPPLDEVTGNPLATSILRYRRDLVVNCCRRIGFHCFLVILSTLIRCIISK